MGATERKQPLIRKAVPEDGAQATALLHASAPRLLDSIFGDVTPGGAQAFLQYAWEQEGGQFGCNAHWVAADAGVISGILTLWHDGMPLSFTQASLRAITGFYGLPKAADILALSAEHTRDIVAPGADELIVGHLAVSEKYRRSGIGSALIAFAEQKARHTKKACCSVDVESWNTEAFSFYRKLGYAEVVPDHAHPGIFTRMSKRL